MIRYLGCALLLAAVAPAGAQMDMPGGGMGGMGGGGRGDRGGQQGDTDATQAPAAPRPPRPVKRERFDKTVAAMFRAADLNRDNIVTLDELRQVIAARRDTLVRARFAHIDRNHDGRIDYAEFAAWEATLGSLASSETQGGGLAGPVAEVVAPDLGDGAEDRVLARLIEPLGAGVLTAANTNYDAGTSLDELLAYERARFDAADTDHDGEISADEARAIGRRDAVHARSVPEADPDQERLHGSGRRP